MKRSALALAALTLSVPAIAAAADKDVAPAATRVPARVQPACDPAAAGRCPQPGPEAGRAQRYRSALAAARPAGDSELNDGVTRVMGDLMAAGRCGDAVSLARRDGRSELAARAQQLCK